MYKSLITSPVTFYIEINKGDVHQMKDIIDIIEDLKARVTL